MLAKVNNHIIKVKMLDSNYNEYASEVQSIDSKYFYGTPFIVENEDLIHECTNYTKSAIVLKEGYNKGKTVRHIKINKAGNVECQLWNDSKSCYVFKTYKIHELNAIK